jgi:hypothetical protein
MALQVNGILADANCTGHLDVLLRFFAREWRQDVWTFLSLTPFSFADVGLRLNASDREVWTLCQREQIVLITANRNDEGPESLEATIAQENTAQSLPVLTFSNDQRVLRDRLYAERVANRLLDVLFDMDSYRGAGRIYLP